MEDKNKDVLTKEGLISHLADMKTALETSLKGDVKEEVAETIKEKMEAVTAMQATVKEIKDNTPAPEVLKKLQEDMATTIKAFDLLQNRVKGFPIGGNKILTLGEAIGEKLLKIGNVNADGHYTSKEIEAALKSPNGSYSLPIGPAIMKAADMTIANSLTGDGVASYNQRQSIIPSQKVNFRDMIPTVMSPTGLYVTYSENTGETNNIAFQTEGASKAQNDYDLTEVKTVNKTLAGIAVFTKQLLKLLPFMQTTLVRMLLRDFYKKENDYFYTTAKNAATGPTSGGTSADDIAQLITLIGAQKDTDFNVSFVVVNNALLARLINNTYTKGYYAGAGAVTLNGAGIQIWGVPVVGASWATANYALFVDSDYIERVEFEGLSLAFSYEDANNFRENKVTARIECSEELNVMRAASLISMNLGAS